MGILVRFVLNFRNILCEEEIKFGLNLYNWEEFDVGKECDILIYLKGWKMKLSKNSLGKFRYFLI